jgi:hypothetical protein
MHLTAVDDQQTASALNLCNPYGTFDEVPSVGNWRSPALSLHGLGKRLVLTETGSWCTVTAGLGEKKTDNFFDIGVGKWGQVERSGANDPPFRRDCWHDSAHWHPGSRMRWWLQKRPPTPADHSGMRVADRDECPDHQREPVAERQQSRHCVWLLGHGLHRPKRPANHPFRFVSGEPVHVFHGLQLARQPFTTNGVASILTDYRIAPDPGSVNPWQHAAPPGGRFTVTLRADVTAGQANTLPLAPTGTPAGTVGLLFLRVYASAQANPKTVSLPTVTFTANGVSKPLPACPATAFPTGAAVQQVLHVLGLPADYM